MKNLTDPEEHPRVTVVVPVHNGRQAISATVEHILNQNLTPHEIIVVDDGSTDGTSEVLKKFAGRISALRKVNGGPASARNYGIRAATGAFVAFTDSDALPDKEWLAKLLGGFDNSRVAGVGGIVRGINSGLLPEYADALRLYDPGRNEEGEISYLVTCNACFRRDALLEAGLFDERFRKPGGEEPELCLRLRRLGYEFRVAEDAVVLHRHKTIRSLLRATSNYGEGGFILGSIWPEYRWKGDARRGLVASLLAMPLAFKKSSTYLPEHGRLKALAFSLLDQSRAVASTWGYLRAERRSRENSA